MEENSSIVTAPPASEANPPVGISSPKDALTASLNKKASDSKKWVAMALGLGSVLGVYVATTLFIVFADTSKSAALLGIATPTITFIGMMVSILLTGQSAVEWRTSASLENVVKSENALQVKKEDTISREVKDVHIDYKEHIIDMSESNKAKPFGQIAEQEI